MMVLSCCWGRIHCWNIAQLWSLLSGVDQSLNGTGDHHPELHSTREAEKRNGHNTHRHTDTQTHRHTVPTHHQHSAKIFHILISENIFYHTAESIFYHIWRVINLVSKDWKVLSGSDNFPRSISLGSVWVVFILKFLLWAPSRNWRIQKWINLSSLWSVGIFKVCHWENIEPSWSKKECSK